MYVCMYLYVCWSMFMCTHVCVCVCVCVGGHARQEMHLVTQRLEVLWKHKNSGSADLLNKLEFFTDDGAIQLRCDIRRKRHGEKCYEKGISAKDNISLEYSIQ